MNKVCVVTGTRAEYGLLKPIMEQLSKAKDVILQLIVTGSHLSPEFGLSYREIEADGFRIDKKVEILLSSDSGGGIAKSMGLAMISGADALMDLKPDLVVVLGDRYEIFAIVSAAYVLGLAIAHISGGEITEGAIDDGFRHSITKMSQLHFTANEEYRRRVIQLGEKPSRVYNVGDTGVENSVSLLKMSKSELAVDLNFPVEQPFFLLTYHPVTQAEEDSEKVIVQILAALNKFPEIPVLMTKANADTDGRIINQKLVEYVGQYPNRARLYDSLGRLRYLSAMSYCVAVIGNSSSGLIEAPALGRPTINIGARQKGRMRAESVIDCAPLQADIEKAIAKALSPDWQEQVKNAKNPYGSGIGVSEKISECILNFLKEKKTSGKPFYDIDFEIQEMI
ncbi:UDP-N-acetylglucosamine 2-epimerase (hydrolyzing) [Clostridiales bacterium COT073_COT-073]|nr:UDP-N-acetylglucosamine 2-epimerase (hydrolyzing) [Clostridiales bacterium COT073_COT-073]